MTYNPNRTEEQRARGNANWRKYYANNRDKINARRKELAEGKPKIKPDQNKQLQRVKEMKDTADGWIHCALISAKHRAKKKGLEFCLEVSDLVMPEYCPVLGIKLEKGIGRNPRRNYSSPTIDRIRNDLGYVKGNVRIISARANSLKSDSTIDELEAVLKYMKDDQEQDSKPKIVHINRHHLAANTKDGGNRPIVSIKHKGTTRYAREVVFNGPCKLRYDGTALECGARTWIETTSDIKLIDEMSFNEARASA